MKKILILLIGMLFVATLNAQYSNKLTYPLYIGKTGTVTGSITFYGITSGTVQLKVPDIAGTSIIFQLPSSNGTADYILKTDGAGALSWTSPVNWNTAYTDRLRWDGGSTDLVAATGRTSLGATDVGSAFFIMTNPSAITFPRINVDNSVSTLSATDFKTALSLTSSDVGLNNLTNKLQVEAEDSTGNAEGNYMPRQQTAELVNDSSEYWLANATVGVAVVDSIGGGGHDYYATPNYVESYIGSGGAGTFTGQILPFIIGVTTGAPIAGDSTISHSEFIGMHVDVYRDGTMETFNRGVTVNTHEGFVLADDEVTVNPPWQTNEQIEIRIRNPNSWSYLTLEGEESDLLDSLAVYYKLDEITGTTLDDAEDNQDAIAGANTTSTNLNVKYNYGRHIGYKSQLRIPYNVAINPSGVFSVSMWIYADSIGTTSGDYLFSIINSGTYTNPHRVYIDTDGKILFKVRNSAGAEFGSISTVALSDSTLYHVVCAFRGDTKTCTIYIDGVDRTTSTGGLTYTFSGTLYPTNGSMYFGNSTTNGVANFRGTMDDCGLWYKILRQANATDLFNSAVTHPFE